MPPFATEAMRAIALVGHGGAGKTTLAEALLHRAGAITAQGSVERGTTVCDFDPLEKAFQHSLASSIVHWAGDADKERDDADAAAVVGLVALLSLLVVVPATVVSWLLHLGTMREREALAEVRATLEAVAAAGAFSRRLVPAIHARVRFAPRCRTTAQFFRQRRIANSSCILLREAKRKHS